MGRDRRRNAWGRTAAPRDRRAAAARPPGSPQRHQAWRGVGGRSMRPWRFVDHGPPLLTVREKKEHLDIVESLQALPAPDRAKHEQRVIECIAFGSGSGDDGHAENALDRATA